MTTKFLTFGTLEYVERLNNSVNGNPRYECCVALDAPERTPGGVVAGRTLRGKTASDAMFAYQMPYAGTPVKVIYHVTARGVVVFDNIEVRYHA